MRQFEILIISLIVLMAFLMSTNVALAGNKALAVVEEGAKAYLDTVLPAIGLEPVYSTAVPADMSEYCLVICQLYGACNPQAASYIENYVNSGGGAVITDGAPYFLAGQNRDLSIIKHWFGAGYYPNDNDTVSVLVDHPFGSSLVSGDTLHQHYPYCNWGAAASNLQPSAHPVAQYHGRCGSSIAAFYYTYGAGKVYYSYSLAHAHVNHTILLKAAMSWASACPGTVEICNAFLTPKNLNVMRSAEHSFKVHVYPCEAMDVSVGDTAEVYVDLDDNGNFDEYENYLTIVSSTDSDGAATDIAVKVYDVPVSADVDPYVAIYGINNTPIVDTAGNSIDYLQLITF
jgi:hypothetical protein